MDVKKLISALTNKEVVDTLTSIIQPIIAQSVACVNDLKGVIDDLRNDITSKNEQLDKLQHENDVLQSSLKETNQRLDLLETYTRVDNLIIKGVPENYSEVITATETGPDALSSDTTLEQVLCLFNSNMNIKVMAADISGTHRLPKGKQDKFKPIIVRFNSRRVRDNVYRARKTLRNSSTPGNGNIYINEHLTKSNEHTFAYCRKLWKEKKISGSWTWHGITYVKLNNGQMKKVVQESDIMDML